MRCILFDYDGTLCNTSKVYVPAFLKTYEYLESLGLAEAKEWEEAEITKWLGFTSKEMWNTFMPELPSKLKEQCGQMLGEEMQRLIREGYAELFPKIPDVLGELLDKEYTLLLLSNCRHSYMQAHKDFFRLDQYFSDFYCSGDYDFQPKYEIFKQIKKEYDGEYIIIGDRMHDMEIAEKHGLLSIGCSYGFGRDKELDHANIRIDKADEIISAVERLCC